MTLNGRPTVTFGISGTSEAAMLPYKLVHLLSHYGLDARAAITRGAGQFVTPIALRAITGHCVYDDSIVFDEESQEPLHLRYSAVDALVVYPASPRVVSECAAGSITCPVTRLFAFMSKDNVIFCPHLHPALARDVYVRHTEVIERLGCRVLVEKDLSPAGWGAVEAELKQKFDLRTQNPSEMVSLRSMTFDFR